MRAAYTPREGSVPWKVIEFLTTNTDEFLTADCVAAKFDVSRNRVHTLLTPAVEAGTLRRDEDMGTGELCYRLGNGHPLVTAQPARYPTLRPGRDAAVDAAPARRPRFWVDVATVEIRSDVPPPKNLTGPRQVDWPALLGRMAVGDSFELPVAAAASLRKAVGTAHKGGTCRFKVSADADVVRCWRLS